MRTLVSAAATLLLAITPLGVAAATPPAQAAPAAVVYSAEVSETATATTIFNYLTSRGATDAGAAGMLGNIQEESRFDPSAIVRNGPITSGGGESAGLLQWSYGRLDALMAKSAARKVPWQNLTFQLDFMLTEMQTQYPATWKVLTRAVSPRAAAVSIHADYVRSASTAEYVLNHQAISAQSWYDYCHTARPDRDSAVVYQYLRNIGISAAGAAGVVETMSWESGLRATAPGGLLGWGGKRLANAKLWAKKSGYNWTDTAVQLRYLRTELTTSFPVVNSYLKRTADPVGAAVVLRQKFLFTGETAATIRARHGAKATAWYHRLSGK